MLRCDGYRWPRTQGTAASAVRLLALGHIFALGAGTRFDCLDAESSQKSKAIAITAGLGSTSEIIKRCPPPRRAPTLPVQRGRGLTATGSGKPSPLKGRARA